MINLMECDRAVIDRYRHAGRRQFWLDYDGSLAPFASHPEGAAPSSALLALLERLSADTRNQIIIISGRDKTTLGKWFGTLPVSLVAEHGAYYRQKGDWMLLEPLSATWKKKTMPYLQALCFHYGGSFVEEKDFSLVWHFRQIQQPLWPEDQLEILNALRSIIPGDDTATIYSEAAAFEIRSKGIDKGRFLRNGPWYDPRVDFGLVLGDGQTDEDLFLEAPDNYVTIKVGHHANSAARYCLPSQADVMPFLTRLTNPA